MGSCCVAGQEHVMLHTSSTTTCSSLVAHESCRSKADGTAPEEEGGQASESFASWQLALCQVLKNDFDEMDIQICLQ